MSQPDFRRPSARLVNPSERDMLAKVTGELTSDGGATLAPQPASQSAKKVRIVVNVSEELQRRIHVRALTRGVTITEYIAELLRHDGVGEDLPFSEAAR